MNITNGVVEFERVVRPADFESKRVKVSLSFAVDDGEDAAVASARVGDMAHVEVFRMLRKAETANAAPVQATKTPAAVVKLPEAAPEVAPEPTPEAEPETPPVTDEDFNRVFRTLRAAGIDGEIIKKTVTAHTGNPGIKSYALDQAARPPLVADLKALKPELWQ